jgi:hypothetical protein
MAITWLYILYCSVMTNVRIGAVIFGPQVYDIANTKELTKTSGELAFLGVVLTEK